MSQHLRAILKSTTELMLCRSGITRAARALRSGATMILAYHNVIPHGVKSSGDRSLHLPQHEFSRQLDLISKTHDIIPLDEVLTSNRMAAAGPHAVITFDDAYCGAVTVGVEELVRRGLPATIFIAPAFLDGRSFWWDALAGSDGRIPDSVRQHCLERLIGKNAAIRAWAIEHGLPLQNCQEHQRAASTAQLSTAVSNAGITLASHTWSHPNLARLSGAELEQEISRPLPWLRKRFEHVIPWLAYPYGLSSYPAERAAERAGYAGAVLIKGGILTRSVSRDRYALPRINVASGLSLAGLELRLAGIG